MWEPKNQQGNGLETQVTVLEGRIEDVELPSQMEACLHTIQDVRNLETPNPATRTDCA